MKKAILFIITILVISLFPSCKENNTLHGNNESDEMYVDLGLPSGTLWKSRNESPNVNDKYGFYTYDEAVIHFQNQLPSKEQWQELLDECKWTWTFGGYMISGNNDNCIMFLSEGEHPCQEDTINGVGKVGSYWSSDVYNEEWGAWYLYYHTTESLDMKTSDRCDGRSIRLIKP